MDYGSGSLSCGEMIQACVSHVLCAVTTCPSNEVAVNWPPSVVGCLPCLQNCSSCSVINGPNPPTTAVFSCLSCSGKFYLEGTQCVLAHECPQNTYADATTHTCAPGQFVRVCQNRGLFAACVGGPGTCQLCGGTPVCSSCTSPFYLTGTSCIFASACPPGTFADSSTHTCTGAFARFECECMACSVFSCLQLHDLFVANRLHRMRGEDVLAGRRLHRHRILCLSRGTLSE